MHSAALTTNSVPGAATDAKHRFNPLRALMDMWERDGVDEDEPGTEVSVMLSSMIGQQFFSSEQD